MTIYIHPAEFNKPKIPQVSDELLATIKDVADATDEVREIQEHYRRKPVDRFEFDQILALKGGYTTDAQKEQFYVTYLEQIDEQNQMTGLTSTLKHDYTHKDV